MNDREGATEKPGFLQQLFKVLDALNRVSQGLRSSYHTPDSDSSTIKALADLRAASNLMFTANPPMVSLSRPFSELIERVQELHDSKPSSHGLKSFLIRRMKSQQISGLASTIESELHYWIDRETVLSLTESVADMRSCCKQSLNLSPSDEDQLFGKMSALQNRLSRAFDMNLQDLLLKSGIFSELEWVLCNPLFSKRVREKAAITIKELVLYNKNVFVGSILVGGSVKALVSMNSLCSLQILSSLIKAIKSPLVDEIESSGGISKIIDFLSSDDLEMRIMAMNCTMEIGYYGRKEAVEALINGGLIKKLVELQRSELGGDLIEMKNIERHPFASCVRRFAVQLEVGEGLRQREKRAFKQQIVKKVREACVSEADYATIVAEVLWGSSPW